MYDTVEELLSFSKKYEHIACYGAKRYGQLVKKFLHEYAIEVSIFIVSEKSEDEKECDCIPILDIAEAIELYGKGSLGIILSVSEKYHDEILENLKHHFFMSDNIYCCSNELFQHINDAFYVIQRDKRLFSGKSTKKNIKFEHEMEKYLSEYTHIVVKNIDCRYIGIIGAEWPYYYSSDIDDSVYYLYYPITLSGSLDMPNDELIYRLCSDNGECLHKKNIQFWQYFVNSKPDFFLVENNNLTAGYYGMSSAIQQLIDTEHNFYSFSEEDMAYITCKLNKMDIAPNYVCISSRDNDYSIDAGDYEPTKIRHGRWRNADIHTYCMAIDYMNSCGIQSVRMGAMVSKPFKKIGVVDYAFREYDQLMDLYLSSHCKFFVSNLSGIITLPILGGKPIVIVDIALLTVRGDAVPFLKRENCIAICKKMWDTRNKRFLTIREMLKYEMESASLDFNVGEGTTRLYEAKGIIPIDNTQEEIAAAVKEMNERIDGTRIYTEAEIKNQEKLEEIFATTDLGDNLKYDFRMCADFLSDNPWLLD